MGGARALPSFPPPAIRLLISSPELQRLREVWCPESDLNRRPTAYEAVALPLSYRGSRLRPAPLTYRIVMATPSRSAARRRPRSAAQATTTGRELPPCRRFLLPRPR